MKRYLVTTWTEVSAETEAEARELAMLGKGDASTEVEELGSDGLTDADRFNLAGIRVDDETARAIAQAKTVGDAIRKAFTVEDEE